MYENKKKPWKNNWWCPLLGMFLTEEVTLLSVLLLVTLGRFVNTSGVRGNLWEKLLLFLNTTGVSGNLWDKLLLLVIHCAGLGMDGNLKLLIFPGLTAPTYKKENIQRKKY